MPPLCLHVDVLAEVGAMDSRYCRQQVSGTEWVLPACVIVHGLFAARMTLSMLTEL